MSEVLAVIPAYNEALNLERVVAGLEQYGVDYVIINDGSTDDTVELCESHGWNYIDLPINLGLAGAFQTGFKYAYRKGYDYAVQFDGDGQHRPEYIAEMKKEMDKGYDIVIGSRFVTEKKPHTFRMYGNTMIALATRLTAGARLTDPTSGMRMFNKKLIREFANSVNYGPEPDTISYLIKQGAKVSEVEVKMDERLLGESYLNFMNGIRYMGKIMFSILLIQNFRRR